MSVYEVNMSLTRFCPKNLAPGLAEREVERDEGRTAAEPADRMPRERPRALRSWTQKSMTVAPAHPPESSLGTTVLL